MRRNISIKYTNAYGDQVLSLNILIDLENSIVGGMELCFVERKQAKFKQEAEIYVIKSTDSDIEDIDYLLDHVFRTDNYHRAKVRSRVGNLAVITENGEDSQCVLLGDNIIKIGYKEG